MMMVGGPLEEGLLPRGVALGPGGGLRATGVGVGDMVWVEELVNGTPRFDRHGIMTRVFQIDPTK